MKHDKYLMRFFAFLVIAGVFSAVFFGVRPRPVPLIDLSGFTDFQEYTKDALLKLDPYAKDNSILLLGFQPESKGQRDLALALSEKLREGPYNFRHVIVDQYLDFPMDGVDKLDSKEEARSMLEKLVSDQQNHQKTLVILPSIYSSHLVPGNLIHRLEDTFHHPLLGVSIFELLRNRELEKSAFIKCEVPETDKVGTGTLGCAILQAARGNYRKKVNSEKWAGLMDQRGQLDFALFLSEK